MKIHFLWVGKTKNKHWKALQEDYLKRLSRFAKYSVTEIKDKASHESVEIEGNRIIDRLNLNSIVCALEVGGESMGSRKLARKFENWQIQGTKQITFVIGGAEGLSPAVVEKADFSLSLSLLTMTHEMARVVLIEQIYRAYTIINGHPYQK